MAATTAQDLEKTEDTHATIAVHDVLVQSVNNTFHEWVVWTGRSAFKEALAVVCHVHQYVNHITVQFQVQFVIVQSLYAQAVHLTNSAQSLTGNNISDLFSIVDIFHVAVTTVYCIIHALAVHTVTVFFNTLSSKSI